jgi:lysophospholipase L1-like esterase
MLTSWRAAVVLFLVTLSAGAVEPAGRKFSFGAARVGFAEVGAGAAYSAERGFGFDLGTSPAEGKAFYFSVGLPEGNYLVTVTLGHDTADGDTTVKAESRRLMVQGVKTKPGEGVARSFVVNLRRPAITGGGGVKLKARELGYLHWDDKLTLEFGGPRPAVRAVEVEPAPADTVTVFLAGDSTVTDQPNEPYNSWGQMLPRFFKLTVAIANHAESGESLRSFTGAKRIDKVWSTIKPGDYLVIQFGHNDQKDTSPGAGAMTTYKDAVKRYVAEARRRGAHAVLVTPVSRRSFGPEGKIVSNLGDFPAAVRQVAKEEDVPLIDLNAMSQAFYEAMGPDGSKKAFAPGDNTHHNNYGSYHLARCVAEGVRRAVPGLARHLADGLPPFDPAKPSPPEGFDVPASPVSPAARKPDGN